MSAALLFAGLPLDVREQDLKELLLAEPTRLPASSVDVTALYDRSGTFLGTFLVNVASDTDAERVRRQFSGQVIDGTYHLAVRHVLPPNVSHPSLQPPTAPRTLLVSAPAPAVQPFGQASASQSRQPRQQPKAAQAKTQPKKDDRPPGLTLLSRLNKPGKAGEREQQKKLLDKQRAALRSKNPGDALLSRLAGKPKPKLVVTKSKNTPAAVKKAAVGGGNKVARAKNAAAGNKMDVDKPVKPKAEKPKPKTQADLDEEMRAYERQRRFAA